MASSVDPLGDLDALLADLQTSIPTGPSASQSPPPPVQQAYSPPPQQPPSSSFTQHDSSHRSPQHYSPPEQNVDRGFIPHTNGGTSYPLNGASEPTYTNGDVDPRGGYNPQRVYYQESKEEVRTETSSSGPNPAPGQGNELDSLLSELNSTRYTASSKERTNGAPLTGSGTRPTVDSLLNELNSVSSSQQQSSRLVQQQQQSMAPQPVTASTATRDLDDLMAELSDFKEDRSWVAAIEDQTDDSERYHPEKVGAGSRNTSGGVTSASYSKNYSYNTSTNNMGSTNTSFNTKASTNTAGGGMGSASSSPLTGRQSSGAGSSSSVRNYTASSSSNTKTAPVGKPPGTPPPRPPTPRSLPTPPPRPPAPEEMVSIPMMLPCPGTPPPIPPPPVPASPSGSMKRRTPVVPPEPFERPDSGGPVKRNDNAYRWITDEVKYEIRERPEEEPPIIPDYQNEKLRSPALVRKLLNRNDTYAKPEKPKSPSPPAPAPPPPPKEPSPPPLANELDCMLGSLANHMTEQGVTTTQKGCCCACDKPIVGQVITALGKTWHPEHFTCTHCSSELGSKNFFERDGQPYCEACYHELFSPRCAYCDGSILDKCVTALDKNWHPDHFFCAQCGTTFGEEGFHEKDGKAYCREDYYNMFAPKCGGCNSPIMENYISALNAQWHPECFVCRDCKQPVTGKSYYAMEGKPVCAACIGVSDDDEDAEEDE